MSDRHNYIRDLHPDATRGEAMSENVVRGWFCEHHDRVVTGEEARRWEMYCRANRRCAIGEEGCKPIWVAVPEPLEKP